MINNIYISDRKALYIHIPFCAKKCRYCDFPSYSGKDMLMHQYVKALCEEIISFKGIKFQTVYIGGGTPTYLSVNEWRLIGKALNELGLERNVEFTVEGNPGTFSSEKLRILRGIGVNRLSIGLQAWQDNLLKTLGRIHSIDDFINAYTMARNEGFNNINIDLMFGIPNQTIEMWNETLKNVVSLNPEHISCYSLIIEEGTPFFEEYKNGKLNLPDEDMERKMYEEGISFLRENGYMQYEISNFSKPGIECRHNIIYWTMQPYIGCGSGAHSYIGGYRYFNCSSIEEYIKRIKESRKAIMEKHFNSYEDELEEFMFMGLRMNKGISIKEFEERFNKDIFDVYGTQIKKFVQNKLLIFENDRLFFSKRGMEVSNSIMCEFILTS